MSGSATVFRGAPACDALARAATINAAFENATRCGGKLENRLLVLLDEAANICPVNELPTWTSTCPSHGITLVTVWQDRSQQRQRYGPEGAGRSGTTRAPS